MIAYTFEPVYQNSHIVAKRLTVYFNSKIINTYDFPAYVEMTIDELDAYIAGKLAMVFA